MADGIAHCAEKVGDTQHRVKLKGSKKRDKYPDVARELKKELWNMNMTVMPIVIGALGTIPKGLVKGLDVLEIRGQVETSPWLQLPTLLTYSVERLVLYSGYCWRRKSLFCKSSVGIFYCCSWQDKPLCISYWKGSLQVPLDYGCQLY